MSSEPMQTVKSRPITIALVGAALAWMLCAQFTDQKTPAPGPSARSGGAASNAAQRPTTDPARGLGSRDGHGVENAAAHLPGRAQYRTQPESWGAAVYQPIRWQAAGYDLPIEIKLSDPDPEIRMDAIHQAYGLDAEAAIPLLQQALVIEKDGVVAEEASAVLVDIGGEDAVSAITTALGEYDVERRWEAVEAIGRIGQPTIHLLGQVLFGDPDPELRLRAVELLSDIASPAAMSLLTAATGDGDVAVSRAAGDAVAAWDRMDTATVAADEYLLSAGYPDVDDEVHELLRDLSPDRRPEQRIDTIQRLYSVEEEHAIGILRHVLQRDEELVVREEALFTLEQMDGDDAARALEVALGDDSPAMRHRAIAAISASESPDRLLVLAQVLYADPDPALRREAVHVLGSDPDPAARLLLQPALTDADQGVRTQAERLFAQ